MLIDSVVEVVVGEGWELLSPPVRAASGDSGAFGVGVVGVSGSLGVCELSTSAPTPLPCWFPRVVIVTELLACSLGQLVACTNATGSEGRACMGAGEPELNAIHAADSRRSDFTGTEHPSGRRSFRRAIDRLRLAQGLLAYCYPKLLLSSFLRSNGKASLSCLCRCSRPLRPDLHH